MSTNLLPDLRWGPPSKMILALWFIDAGIAGTLI
jgi:hypothetical protein